MPQANFHQNKELRRAYDAESAAAESSSSNAIYLDMGGGSAPPTYSECWDAQPEKRMRRDQAANNFNAFPSQLMQSAAVKMFRKIEKEEKQGPLKGPANELKHRSNLADARSKVQCLHDSVNMNAEQIAESIRDIEKCIEYAKQARLKDNSGSCGVILCFCFFVVCVVFIWIIAPKTRK